MNIKDPKSTITVVCMNCAPHFKSICKSCSNCVSGKKRLKRSNLFQYLLKILWCTFSLVQLYLSIDTNTLSVAFGRQSCSTIEL